MRRVYYNEIDRRAASWLRELMAQGLIAEGVVDERPIQDVQPKDLHGFDQCHFFAGIGGWSCALRLAGWPDDVPVWTGSCPCQPFSTAGAQRGTKDERHLWPELFRLIEERRPPVFFGEQVAAAVSHDWLDLVSSDLECADYAFGSAVFPAAGVGAPHLRDRLYFVAHSDGGWIAPQLEDKGQGALGTRLVPDFWADAEWLHCPDGKRRAVKPGVRPLADGIPGWMDLLRGAGNAIVPQAAAEFIRAAVEAVQPSS